MTNEVDLLRYNHSVERIRLMRRNLRKRMISNIVMIVLALLCMLGNYLFTTNKWMSLAFIPSVLLPIGFIVDTLSDYAKVRDLEESITAIKKELDKHTY